MNKPEHTTEIKPQVYHRFSLDQRIEHLLFLISFSTLGFTGLIQKFFDSPISQVLINLLGGIESTRLIHRTASIVMMLVSAYHVIALVNRLFVYRVSWSMLPTFDDVKHVIQDVLYNLGRSTRKAYYGRYSYGEKMEYLAVVWGTVIMGITGFMMWNPIATTRFFPGEFIPAAKAAHGGEAILAVLAIILWHFYNVHIKMFNKSMFTGTLTHHEMAEEHPAELALIEAGKEISEPDPIVLRKRQKVFYPVAGIMALTFTFGLWFFVKAEDSAITTLPRGETVQAFVPVTPTPRPTPTPTPTPDPNQPVGAETWEGNYAGLFRDRCGTCHYNTAVGGLRLDTFENALKGGNNGPGIVPNNPDQSLIVQIQLAGGHPGQLSAEEINQITAWIEAGAPEK